MSFNMGMFFAAGFIRYSIEGSILQSQKAVFILLFGLLPVTTCLLLFVYERTPPRFRKINFWVSNTARLLTLHHRVLIHSLRNLIQGQMDHHSTTPSSTPSFPRFFDLPGELRNLVYDFVLATNVHAVLYQGGTPRHPRVALGILRASRRLRAEARPILYRRAHFITTARFPFTQLVGDEWVSMITSLTLRADLSIFMKYDRLEHALATEIPRLRNLVRLTIRFETVVGMYGSLNVAGSIVACVATMENLRSLELEGVRRAPETQLLADSIRGQLGDTVLSWRGEGPDNQTVVIMGTAGPLRVVS